MTAAESLAALLETAPPEMREALTEGHVTTPWECYNARSEEGCVCGKVYRVPLPIDSAHVALERWWVARGGRIVIESDAVYADIPTVFQGKPHEDIFAAVSAALGEA